MSDHDQRASGKHLISSRRREALSEKRSRRVLVIDDNEAERAHIVGVLRAGGFEVFELTSAIGATRQLIQNEIHVVIADIGLPGLAGGALVSVLRSNPRLSDLTVVLVSKTRTEELARIGREQAVTAVLDKRDVEARLVVLVQRALLTERSRKWSAPPARQSIFQRGGSR